MTTPRQSDLHTILTLELAYNERNKALFHKEGKRVLKNLAQALGLSPKEYEVRSNKGGIAVSGEVTLHTNQVYVQVSQNPLCQGDVMYRTCDGRKDCRGHGNNFAGAEALQDLEGFARTLKALVERRQKRRSANTSEGVSLP